jgi:hypothetical protein
MKFKINWDAFGIAASVACAIHCAILPLFLSSLTLLGVNIVGNILFESMMILLAFSVGIYSLYHGVKKHHHNWLPIIIFSIGMLCLFAKQIWHTWEVWFLVPAVFLIVAAHYNNYRLCRKHNHAHDDDCNH